jgi:hypothetical protein
MNHHDQKRSHPMRKDTKKRKKAIQALGMTREQEWWNRGRG